MIRVFNAVLGLVTVSGYWVYWTENRFIKNIMITVFIALLDLVSGYWVYRTENRFIKNIMIIVFIALLGLVSGYWVYRTGLDI